MGMFEKVKRIICLVMAMTFVMQQVGFAQMAMELNVASHLSRMAAPAIEKFRPVHLRYFSYNPSTDQVRLLLDKGDVQSLDQVATKESTQVLMKYFLIGISLPNEKFWVNLRPDASERIIDPVLEQTDLGKVLLAADVQLKKDTAKYTNPETPTGKEYWDKVYKKAGELFGSEQITIPTLTRPWIVPNEVIIRESADSAYIYKATMKVMLEQDHLKNSDMYAFNDPRMKALNEYSSQLIRELIIPQLTKEVNNSKKYSDLRQVFYSLVMARWFKLHFKGAQGKYAQMIDKGKMTGLASTQSWSKDTYFQQYKESFDKGEYNVKAVASTVSGQVIRTYVSGGVALQSVNPTGALSAGVVQIEQVARVAGMDPVDANGNPVTAATFDHVTDTGMGSQETIGSEGDQRPSGIAGKIRWVQSSGSGTIRVYGENNVELKRLHTYSGTTGLALFPGNKRIVTVNGVGQIDIIDVDSGKQIKYLHTYSGATDVAVFPDGKTIVAVNHVGQINIIDVDSGKQIKYLHTYHGTNFVAVSPDGTMLATANGVGQVEIIDVESGKQMQYHHTWSGGVSLKFTDDGKHLVINSRFGHTQKIALSGLTAASAKTDVSEGDVTTHGNGGESRLFSSRFTNGGTFYSPDGFTFADQGEVYHGNLVLKPLAEAGLTPGEQVAWDSVLNIFTKVFSRSLVFNTGATFKNSFRLFESDENSTVFISRVGGRSVFYINRKWLRTLAELQNTIGQTNLLPLLPEEMRLVLETRLKEEGMEFPAINLIESIIYATAFHEIGGHHWGGMDHDIAADFALAYRSTADEMRLQTFRGVLFNEINIAALKFCLLYMGIEPRNLNEGMAQSRINADAVNSLVKKFISLLPAGDTSTVMLRELEYPGRGREQQELTDTHQADERISAFTGLLEAENYEERMRSAYGLSLDEVRAQDPVMARIGFDGTANRLGWSMENLEWIFNHRETVDAVLADAEAIRSQYEHVIFCGMGGSGLSVQVVKSTFGEDKIHIYSLRTTDPAVIKDMLDTIAAQYGGDLGKALAKTLIIPISKSGDTKETISHKEFFEELLRKEGLDPQNHMWVVTDERPADKAKPIDAGGYPRRDIQLNKKGDIGGRFTSPTTNIFLLPLALVAPEQVWPVLRRTMEINNGIGANKELFLKLAAFLYYHAKEKGRDKITIIVPKEFKDLPLWAEQLIEESLGKDGKGVTLFYGENLSPEILRSPDMNDRVFVRINIGGTETNKDLWDYLQANRYPVFEIGTSSKTDIGGVMLGLQRAVLGVAYLWDICAVDQPAVEGYKKGTREVMAELKDGETVTVPASWQQASFGENLKLYYGPLLETGAVSEAQIDQILERIQGSRNDAAAVYAAILIILNSRSSGFEAAELTSYGRMTQGLRWVLESARYRIFTRGLRMASKLGEGPDKNHSYHQNIDAGKDMWLSTYFMPLSMPMPTDVEYNDTLIKAQTIGTVNSLVANKRKVVLISVDTYDTNNERQMAAFFDTVAKYMMHNEVLGSEETQAASSGTSSTTGGIDFRQINMILKPMGTFANIQYKLPFVKNVSSVDLDKEMNELQTMVKSGIIPSGERVAEFLAVCKAKDEVNARRNDLLACVINICRLQEDELVETSQDLKQVMVLAEAL